MAKTTRPDTITLEDGRFKLQFEPQIFWQHLRGAIVHFFDGGKAGGAEGVLKALGSFSKTNSLEYKAFDLIFTALHKTCTAILTENPEQERLLEKIGVAGVRNVEFRHAQGWKLSSGGYELTADFFAAPHRDPLTRDARADFQMFLETVLGLGAVQARALAVVLPGRFTYELAAEWNRGDYQPIAEHFKNNPVLPALQQQAAREKRHADLLRAYAKPAFSDPKVSLSEMYIEPAFWIHSKCIPESRRDAYKKVEGKTEHFDFFKPKGSSDLHDFFLQWVSGQVSADVRPAHERLLVVLGQPGQGKTSFFLRTIFQLLYEHYNPYRIENLHFVRLRDIVNVQQLFDDPLTAICKHLKIKPESEYLHKSLFLLDGLDELYMSQGLGLSQIHDFVRKVRKELKNETRFEMRVALTSRTNYLQLDTLDIENFYVLHLADLTLEQQKTWLKKYRRHRPDCCLSDVLLEKVAKEKVAKNQDDVYTTMRELLYQPILLQIVADSGVEIDTGTNTALIYEQLFDRVINTVVKRKWSPDDGPLDIFQQIEPQDLRRFLQVLALYIFQKKSEQAYARRTDFSQPGLLRDSLAELRDKASQTAFELQDLVKHLLVSFYFQEVRRDTEEKRQSDDHSEYAYEFLHKSLQEYLVAEHIWETCEEKLLEKNKRDKYHVQKPEEAMAVIRPLFERKILSQEIAGYLRAIVQHRTADKAILKARMREFLSSLLEQHFLFEHQAGPGDPPAMEKILSNFYGFWSVASALVEHEEVDPKDEKAFTTVLEKENLILERTKSIFAHMVVLLQRLENRKLFLACQNLRGAYFCGVNLRGTYLRGVDLRGADLRGADLREAYLRRANLSGANFSGADLRGAYLREADIHRADLRRADLRRADLNRADLNGADLSEAYLREAKLDEADLREANLSEAKLSKANLSRANLSEAGLRGADLSEIGLSEAKLFRAGLRWADLSGANLFKADLRGADIRGANLQKADLREADLREATFSRANLSGADLSGADLRGANLREAKLDWADLSNTNLGDKNWIYANFTNADLTDIKGLETAIGLKHANFTGTLYEGKFSKKK